VRGQTSRHGGGGFTLACATQARVGRGGGTPPKKTARVGGPCLRYSSDQLPRLPIDSSRNLKIAS